MSDPLIFTDNATEKVWELIQEEGNLDLKLRVYVTGGGCSALGSMAGAGVSAIHQAPT